MSRDSRPTIVLDERGRLAAFSGGIAAGIHAILSRHAGEVENAREGMLAAAARAAQRQADERAEATRGTVLLPGEV